MQLQVLWQQIKKSSLISFCVEAFCDRPGKSLTICKISGRNFRGEERGETFECSYFPRAAAEMFCEAENWAARGQRGSPEMNLRSEMIFRTDCLQLSISEHIFYVSYLFLLLNRPGPTASNYSPPGCSKSTRTASWAELACWVKTWHMSWNTSLNVSEMFK